MGHTKHTGWLLFLVLALLLYLPCPAQSDSLRQVWAQMPADTHALRWLHQALRAAHELPADSLFTLAGEGLELATQLKDPQGMAFMQLYQGLAKAYEGDFETALPYFEHALSLQLARRDTLQAGLVLINLGLAHYYLGNTGLALVQYERAADYLHRRDQSDARLLHNIAMIYRKQGKYAQAAEYYQRSLAIKQAAGDSLGLANTRFNLATLHHQQGQTEAALAYARQALRAYEQTGDAGNEAATHTVLGSIFLDTGQQDRAAVSLERAGAYFAQHPEAHYALETCSDRGRLAAARQDWGQAESLFRQALEMAQKQGRKEEQASLHLQLSQALAAQGAHPAAYAQLDSSRHLQAALSDALRLALMEEMQARFEVGEAVYAQKMQGMALRQQQRLSGILLGGAGLVIAGILYFLYQKNRGNRLLKGKNELIARALAEKEALMREMHHRIKNNLQFLSSLLRLQTRHLEDAGARDALMASRSRVLAMALVHRHLYQEEPLATIQVHEYLDRLVAELVDSYQDDHFSLVLDTAFDALSLDVDQAVPLGLIVNELVCNAMKYAFPGRESGRLSISLKQAPEALVLRVADDGTGGPTAYSPNEQTGFGHRLVQLLAEKLHAHLSVVSQPGMTVSLTIPYTAPLQ